MDKEQIIGICLMLGILAVISAILWNCVVADTNVGIDIFSNESVNVWGNIFTNGTVGITIDGTNYPQVLEQMEAEKLEWRYIEYIFQWMSRWFRGMTDVFDEKGFAIFTSLREVFFTRPEGNLLNVRLTALEKTIEKMNAEAYCQGKIDTMKQFNLTAIRCGNTTWYNQRTIPIGIEPLE